MYRNTTVAVMLVLVAFGALGACSDNPGFCTAVEIPGVRLKVTDSSTGVALACSANAWLIEGEFMERLEPTGNCSAPDSLASPWMEGAYERPGVYTILVMANGYLPWVKSNVEVKLGPCHVVGVVFDVDLNLEAAAGGGSAIVSSSMPQRALAWFSPPTVQ